MRRHEQSRARKVSLIFCALFMLFAVLVWILFVGGTRHNEMFLGAGVVVVSGMFSYRICQIETISPDFHAADIVQGWRIPWYLLSGIYEIVVILIKDLLGFQRADSFYRVSGFKTSKSDSKIIARQILAVFYTTIAPNFIVIGIDSRQNRMLFHQLERSTVPKMTKALGAQSGAKSP